ncbi:signal peptidase I [Granulicella cerasi]|uniref:Signal peptidase I n=1 Tax=Granulicella cerasi TaxID=741063 RepID=A0ABW1ZDB5_9BACT|nr:signal peptidase I [Granulicella cerasi]
MEEQTKTDANAEQAAPPKPVEVRANGLSAWVRDLILIVFVFSAFLYFYRPVRVEGTSMLPQLEDEDRLLINRHVGLIHRGEVVVFLYPHDTSKSYIKRVIALPGDHLSIDHGQVWVNGDKLKETYVPQRFEDDRSQPEMTIPEGEYFVMGDHRSISSDSRDFGPVPAQLIYGRAAFVYWPMDQAGMVR